MPGPDATPGAEISSGEMVGMSTDDERVRRGARRCVPPLGLLAVAFVLPTVHSCMGPISPLSFGLMFPEHAVITWPIFLLAAALAAMTLLRRAEGARLDRARVVLAVPVLAWVASLWPAVHGAGASATLASTDDLIAVAAVLVALPLSIGAFARALRATGWSRWRHAIDSFAAAAWLMIPPQYVFARLLEGRFRGLEYGAYSIAAAMVWLSAAAVVYRR